MPAARLVFFTPRGGQRIGSGLVEAALLLEVNERLRGQREHFPGTLLAREVLDEVISLRPKPAFSRVRLT